MSSLTPEQLSRYNETKQPALLGSLSTSIVICNISVAMRCISQWRNTRQFFLDDTFVLAAGVFLNAVAGNLLCAEHYGLGLHDWRVNAQDPHMPHKLSKTFQHVWLTMVFQAPCLSAIRLSLLFFNRRLFLVHQRWLCIAWWVNFIYEIMWAFGATGFYLFQCWPPEWYWLQYYAKYNQAPPTFKHGQCNAQTVSHVALPFVFSLFSDVTILTVPVIALSQLQMTWKRKAAMSALFPVGLGFCLLEIGRIVALYKGTNDKSDASWGVTNFLILSVATQTTGILRACLPVLMPRILLEATALHDWWRSKIGHRRARNSVLCVQQRSKGFRRFGALDHSEGEETPRLKTIPRVASEEPLSLARIEATHHSGQASRRRSNEHNDVLVRTDIEVMLEEGQAGQPDPFYLPYLGLSPMMARSASTGVTSKEPRHTPMHSV